MNRSQVLVSDDEVAVTDAVEKRLRLSGIDVISDSTSNVVETASIYQPQAILLDLLQHRDGLVLLRELKANPHTERIPTFLMAATVDDGEEAKLRRAARQFRAADLVAKPLSDEFLEALTQFCEGAPADNSDECEPEIDDDPSLNFDIDVVLEADAA
jgi:CheY-like chemotaxis protein